MAEKKPKLIAHRCTVCGAQLREGQYVYSQHTKNRYCLDTEKHRRISKRRKSE